MLAKRLAAFGSSIFGEMTRLATEHEAINLSQGFPDFEGPPAIIDAAIRAMRDGHNQYARPRGATPLVEAITERAMAHYDLAYDPMTEVCVTCGATEAIAASLLGLLDPGDEVLSLEPFYDSYPAVTALAGGVFRSVPLRFPDFRIDFDALRAAVNPRTKVMLINTPHNPTGRVFDAAELEGLATICIENELIAVSDEVYEHLWFDDHEHRPLATVDGMRDRTITISSTGKTFSMTGWKTGWAYGSKELIDAVFAAHQFLTFSTAAPLQHAMAFALRTFTEDWLAQFRVEYDERRRCLLEILEDAGFSAARPQGSYFILAGHEALFAGGADDLEVATRLVRDIGVAAIPPSSFYDRAKEEGRRLLRFAFCKRIETLHAAGTRMSTLRNSNEGDG